MQGFHLRPTLLAVGLLALNSLLLTGCSDCDDATAEADEFLGSSGNLACQTDADCVVESAGCAKVARSFCGQVSMNREASASTTWRAIKSELEDCNDESCAQCLALLIPTCTQGSCGRN